MEFDRNSNYVLAVSDPVKKNSVFIFILILLYLKIRRRSLDDVTKNSVFIVVCLRNHEKYSYLFHDVIMVVKSTIFKLKVFFNYFITSI